MHCLYSVFIIIIDLFSKLSYCNMFILFEMCFLTVKRVTEGVPGVTSCTILMHTTVRV